MTKSYIEVEVSRGVFSSERCADFALDENYYCLIADESFFVGSLMEVHLIQIETERSLVEFPADTFVHGRRAWVPNDRIDIR